MKSLKFLVIFMAILIVFGVGFLVFTISTGLHHKNTSSTDTIEHTVTLTDNQMLLDYHVDQGHMLLHIMDIADGRRYWKIIDYQTGENIGRINLELSDEVQNTAVDHQ